MEGVFTPDFLECESESARKGKKVGRKTKDKENQPPNKKKKQESPKTNTQQSTIKILKVCNQANCDPQLHYQQPIYQSQQTHPTLMYKQQLQQQSEYADLSQSHPGTQLIYQSQQTLFPPHQSLPAPQYGVVGACAGVCVNTYRTLCTT